jgi:transcription elongation GreA/GreB family factor
MSVPTLETIKPGTWVKVRGLVPGVETVIRFVSQAEVNHFEHKFATNCPLARALVGVDVGDTVALDNDRIKLNIVQGGCD